MVDTVEQTAAPGQQARLWVIKMDAGELSEADRVELRLWLQADAQHREAFRKARSTWQLLDSWADTTDPESEALPAELRALIAAENPALPRSSGVETESPGRGEKPAPSVVEEGFFERRRRFLAGFPLRPQLALAASLLLCVCLFGLWQLMPLPEGHYRTGKGEQLTRQLADGSTLMLNTDSYAEVEYTEAERRITLRAGEAYFTVAHDTRRPFVVYAGGGHVRAVGTAFNVYKDATSVSVIVTEGTVEVSKANDRNGESETGPVEAEERKRVTVNQSLVYKEKLGVVTEREPDDIQKRLSWRRNTLHFDNTSLEAFVEEFNRYSSNRIVIVDAELKKIRIGGVFKAGDADAALTALKASFNVESMGVTPYLTLLYRKDSEPL